MRDLRPVPALAKGPGARGNDVKAQNRRARGLREQHRAGFRHVTRPARPVHGEGSEAALSDRPDHLHQRARAAPAARPARRAVTVLPDDSAYVLAVEVLAGHYHDAAPSPEPRRGKNFAVPESVDQTFSELESGFEVLPAHYFPAQRAADQQDGEVANPGGDEDLESLPGREGARVFSELRAGLPDRAFLFQGRFSSLE